MSCNCVSVQIKQEQIESKLTKYCLLERNRPDEVSICECTCGLKSHKDTFKVWLPYRTATVENSLSDALKVSGHKTNVSLSEHLCT